MDHAYVATKAVIKSLSASMRYWTPKVTVSPKANCGFLVGNGNTVWRVNVPAGTTVNNPHDMGEGWSAEIPVPFADMGLEGHLDGRTFGWNVTGMNYHHDSGNRNRLVISWSNPVSISPEDKAINIVTLHHYNR